MLTLGLFCDRMYLESEGYIMSAEIRAKARQKRIRTKYIINSILAMLVLLAIGIDWEKIFF